MRNKARMAWAPVRQSETAKPHELSCKCIACETDRARRAEVERWWDVWREIL